MNDKNYAVKSTCIYIFRFSLRNYVRTATLVSKKVHGLWQNMPTYVLYVQIKCTYLFAQTSSMAIRLVVIKLNVHGRSLGIPWSIFTFSVLQYNAICEILMIIICTIAVFFHSREFKIIFLHWVHRSPERALSGIF